MRRTGKPRILVTASRGDAVTDYLEALREAGAEPIRAEPGDPARRLLDDAHGVLLTGGIDVDPASYHAPASPLVHETEPERDVFEIDVLRAAQELQIPTLCICRGLQIANVAYGGTLLDDIPTQLGPDGQVRHRVAEGNRSARGLIREHVVRIDEESLLARIVGSTALVTGSRHHQAVDAIAHDLRVVGRTPDGIVEALEARFVSPFWLAVQWHPECTREFDDGASRAIFRALANAAQRSENRPS